ncbi:unnamed protein product [Closterium sp. NIES-53]
MMVKHNSHTLPRSILFCIPFTFPLEAVARSFLRADFQLTPFYIMAFIRARSVLLFAFLAAALMAAATAKKKKPVPRKSSPYDPFDASLYGYLEIPKNDSEAARNAVGDPSGMVTMRLNIYKQNGKPVWLDYIVATFDMEGEMPPTATHVHNATEGSNGPKGHEHVAGARACGRGTSMWQGHEHVAGARNRGGLLPILLQEEQTKGTFPSHSPPAPSNPYLPPPLLPPSTCPSHASPAPLCGRGNPRTPTPTAA